MLQPLALVLPIVREQRVWLCAYGVVFDTVQAVG